MSSQSGTMNAKEIEILSDPENIRLVEEFIEELKIDLSFKDDVYGNVMVATTEAVNNGIVHGNKCDADKKVFVRSKPMGKYRLCIEVEDQGPGFDPEALPDPTAPENLEKAGGRGVFIMSHLCDELKFGNEGRKVEMIFNI